MSAREYRARAAALVTLAHATSSYAQILQAEALAREWRQLAQFADWQDALMAALAECGIEPPRHQGESLSGGTPASDAPVAAPPKE